MGDMIENPMFGCEPIDTSELEESIKRTGEMSAELRALAASMRAEDQ